MTETALLYFRKRPFNIVTRVLEIPVKKGSTGLDALACPLRLIQEADRIELYRDGKFAMMLKDHFHRFSDGDPQ